MATLMNRGKGRGERGERTGGSNRGGRREDRGRRERTGGRNRGKEKGERTGGKQGEGRRANRGREGAGINWCSLR